MTEINTNGGVIVADIEKVIDGLEHCRLMCEGVSHNPCKGCQYQGKYDCADTLKTDALELLKEYAVIKETMSKVIHETAKMFRRTVGGNEIPLKW